ncbi:hypothetical protein EVAR_39431_1 [Eumeta japonica]|uniref:Uncharacterized protein n=1 Tax=Eumeta variegata TaxID=151549 RepID=A0A4C1W2K1_EUMVA|nr:hypothetical protein EVAR_39431_1 [Eumeta japonica]
MASGLLLLVLNGLGALCARGAHCFSKLSITAAGRARYLDRCAAAAPDLRERNAPAARWRCERFDGGALRLRGMNRKLPLSTDIRYYYLLFMGGSTPRGSRYGGPPFSVRNSLSRAGGDVRSTTGCAPARHHR